MHDSIILTVLFPTLCTMHDSRAVLDAVTVMLVATWGSNIGGSTGLGGVGSGMMWRGFLGSVVANDPEKRIKLKI